MSIHTHRKALRLLELGHVEPDPTPAQVFHVQGDTGRYLVVITPTVQTCNCPATGRCSHIEAAVRWLLADEDDRAEYETALADRHRRDTVKANDLFARLT